MPKKKTDKPKDDSFDQKKWDKLMRNYSIGSQDMESRMNRKNGWRDTLKAYLNVIPTPWAFQAKVTAPLIRTTILEKNGRLLNSKLRGKLVPREHGDMMKARINNAILDLQWDRADTGGSMLEKVAKCDLNARIFGAAFVWIYWDNQKDCNEMKVLDNRDVLIDPRLEHLRGAQDDNWVMVREWLTRDALIAQGYEVPVIEDTSIDNKSTAYDAIVKNIRGVTDNTDTKDTGVLEVIHQLKNKETITFLPRHKLILKEKKSKKDKIQVAMLRYYPLPEDIYGESEVEPVISVARTVNWFLSGFVEEGNKMLHPPTIVSEVGVRRETIVHTPGAIWIANNPDLIREMPMGSGIIAAFNNVYPMLKAEFNTAMGSQSLGVSNIQGYQTDKTATEVKDLAQQQNSRDQYNQLYLGEFLKDVMMMWVANNKEYLFDDPTKKHVVMRIVGQEQMKQFQKMGLNEMDVPPEAMDEMIGISSQYQQQYGSPMPDNMLQSMVNGAQAPRYPVVTNPEEQPENYEVVPKLNMMGDEEADLYVEPSDMEGIYDFIPDVVSMGAGANLAQKQGRLDSYNLATTPETQQMLAADGYRLKGKELLSTIFADNNFNDADSYFEKIQQPVNPAMPGVDPTQGQPGLPVPQGMAGGAIPMANASPQAVSVNG